MPVPVFSARTIKGKLVISNYEKFVSYLHSMPVEVEVIVRKRGNKNRSDSQNAYYFAVIVKIISEHIGETKDRTHKLLKEKHLTEEVTINTEHGEVTGRVTRSTRDLTTVEMEEYLENVRMWASETLGLSIPTPQEVE